MNNILIIGPHLLKGFESSLNRTINIYCGLKNNASGTSNVKILIPRCFNDSIGESYQSISSDVIYIEKYKFDSNVKKSRYSSRIKLYLFLLHKLRRDQFDIVINYSAGGNLFQSIEAIIILLITKLYSKKYCSHFADALRFPSKYFEKVINSITFKLWSFIVKKSNISLVINSFLYDLLQKECRTKCNIFLLPPLTSTPSKPNNFNRKNNKIVLYSGNLSYDDGLLDLIEAHKSQEHPFEWSLHITGICNESPSICKEIMQVLYEYKNKNFVFHGYVSQEELNALYEVSNIFVVTKSSNEKNNFCFPGKLIYAMSVLNMPVVCADFGDIKSYFIDGHDLEYYKPGDVASLNHKITLLLDNPQHAEKLSKNASKTVTKVLDRNYWGFKLLNELNSL